MADTPYKVALVPEWVNKSYGATMVTPTLRAGWGIDTKLKIRPNPRCLPNQIVSILVSADRCAKCLGELDTGWECNDCGFDWKPWMDESKRMADEAHDRREA